LPVKALRAATLPRVANLRLVRMWVHPVATLPHAVISHLGLTLVLPVATLHPGSPPRASLRVSLNLETVEKCSCRVMRKSGLRALKVKRLKA
jgi:hypothetical protein